ncbi:hypothetical protein HK101_011600 [Irineochytrium annulatum]|nr:hypothetical protein HK101_011600 [Irineochytrium annulatum]
MAPVQGEIVLNLEREAWIGRVRVQVQGGITVGLLSRWIPLSEGNGGNGGGGLGAEAFSTTKMLWVLMEDISFLDTITLYPPNLDERPTNPSTPPPLPPPTRLHAGRHAWPFSFRVPPVTTLPPTYRSRHGCVRYEVVATLERENVKTQRVAREFGVRSVEGDRIARDLGDPVEVRKEVGGGPLWALLGSNAAGKKSWARGGGVAAGKGPCEVIMKMDRGFFHFGKFFLESFVRTTFSQIRPAIEQQIPVHFTVTNPGPEPLLLTALHLEERVHVHHGPSHNPSPPILTTCIPFPVSHRFPPGISTKTVRLTLPRLEPTTPIPSPMSSSSTPQGLNGSFTTTLLRVSHQVSATLRSAQRLSQPRAVRCGVALVVTPRERSLMHRAAVMNAVVEDAEREAEGRGASIDTLPLYEPRISSDVARGWSPGGGPVSPGGSRVSVDGLGRVSFEGRSRWGTAGRSMPASPLARETEDVGSGGREEEDTVEEEAELEGEREPVLEGEQPARPHALQPLSVVESARTATPVPAEPATPLSPPPMYDSLAAPLPILAPTTTNASLPVAPSPDLSTSASSSVSSSWIDDAPSSSRPRSSSVIVVSPHGDAASGSTQAQAPRTTAHARSDLDLGRSASQRFGAGPSALGGAGGAGRGMRSVRSAAALNWAGFRRQSTQAGVEDEDEGAADEEEDEEAVGRRESGLGMRRQGSRVSIRGWFARKRA